MRALLAFAACLSLGACTVFLGGRPDTCGEYPAGGGPAVIATKDQMVCDVVRLRVGREIDLGGRLDRDAVDALTLRVPSWEKKATIEELAAAVRKDAGDEVADELLRAVDAVLAQSSLPMPAGSEDTERCLVRGAARGLHIALLYARPRRGMAERPPDAQ